MIHVGGHGAAVVLLAAMIASASGGCVLPYSRVGGSAHRKLYRGSLEEVGKAVERALPRAGYREVTREAREGGAQLAGTGPDSARVEVELLPQEGGLVRVSIGQDSDWREAVRVHQKVAEELGVATRRDP